MIRRGDLRMAIGDGRAAGRKLRGWAVLLALAAIAAGWPAAPVFGKAAVRDVTQPIPVLNTGGHSAPVRALVFAPPGGGLLLSAGLDKVVNLWNLRDDAPAVVRTIRPR